jgi:hypothetical protein
MQPFRISSQNNFLEISLDPNQGIAGRRFEDYRIEIEVCSSQFSAKTHCHIAGSDLVSFFRGLISLEQSRGGEVTLESISPDSFKLRLFSTTRMGHMAIEGSLSHSFMGERLMLPHSLSFGFEFDPSELAKIVGYSWVRALAS